MVSSNKTISNYIFFIHFYTMTLSSVDLNDIFMLIKLALTLFTDLNSDQTSEYCDWGVCREMGSSYDSFAPSSSRRFVWKLMETGLITPALYLIKSSPLKLKDWTVILNTKCSPQDTLAGNNIVWLCLGADCRLCLIWIGLTDSSAAVLRTRGILGDVWICRQMNCECGTRVNSTPQR